MYRCIYSEKEQNQGNSYKNKKTLPKINNKRQGKFQKNGRAPRPKKGRGSGYALHHAPQARGSAPIPHAEKKKRLQRAARGRFLYNFVAYIYQATAFHVYSEK